MAKPYQEGKGWAVRIRVMGQDIYLSGYPSETAALRAAEQERVAITQAGTPSGSGPYKTTLAQALQKYGLERLPSLKGARQNAGRINRYLRLAGLQTLQVEAVDRKQRGGNGAYFKVTLSAEPEERPTPASLKAHRKALLKKSAASDQLRQQLALMPFADIMPHHVQQIMDAMLEEGYEPATLEHERTELRQMFNHARKCWRWTQPGSNPAVGLKMPRIQNERDRVLTNSEWEILTQILAAYDNPYALPAFILLVETTMRSSEPLLHASWSNVDWDRCVLKLQDAKAGARLVPLSPNAVVILKYLQSIVENAGPEQPILPTTYEALKKAWHIACEKAGIDDAQIHDLRHTGTTRYAIEYNGNLPLLKLITGHKTYSQLMRYINLKVDDAVAALHARPLDEALAPAGYKRSTLPAHLLQGQEAGVGQAADNIVAFPARRTA